MTRNRRKRSPKNVTAVTCVNENRFAQRRADALLTLAETTLRHGPEPSSTAERYQVVVHVTAETLSGNENGCCELDMGQPNAPDKARRIACDNSLIQITEDETGFGAFNDIFTHPAAYPSLAYKVNNHRIALSRQSIGSRIRRNYRSARPLIGSAPWIFS